MSSPRYWELSVETPEEASEGLTNFLWELGALGVIEEASEGRAPRLRAFFPKTLFARALEQGVREYLGGLAALGFRASGEPAVVALAGEDWADAWRAHFRPVPAGKRLLIAPPWDRPPVNGRVVITIEPGRAFGTGQHGSTLGCLTALEALLARATATRLLDLGTGSGILAVAAARLGVPSVVAVDEDPNAVAAAMANAARNRVSDRVRCVLADAGALQETGVPVVVANLLTAAHLRLAPRYARYVAPGGGALVLGGILDAEAPGLAAALAGRGFAPDGSLSLEGWTTLTLRRGPGAPLHARA